MATVKQLQIQIDNLHASNEKYREQLVAQAKAHKNALAQKDVRIDALRAQMQNFMGVSTRLVTLLLNELSRERGVPDPQDFDRLDFDRLEP